MANRFPIALLLLTLASCGPGDDAGNAAGDDADRIVQEKERGPVKVRLEVEPTEPTFADRIHFSVTAEAEKNVDVPLPTPGEDLVGSFLIKDFHFYPPTQRPDGTRESRQTYVLEVVTSGEYTIPAMRISFVDRREESSSDSDPPSVDPPPPPSGDEPATQSPEVEPEVTDEAGPKVFKIVTDPIPITVKSLEDADAFNDLAPIAGVAEPDAIPASWKWPLVFAGGVLGLGILVGIAVFLVKHERRPRPRPVVPPEQIAYRELEWLVAQEFTERGELKEFFFHLSRIVREYIERRFALRAPERTTEEFLEDLARSDRLEEAHKRLLTRFLEKADLVKFAKYDPGPEEIESSFDAAKKFIAETIPRAEEVASGVR